ncbi:MAG: type I-E CRISPR-associated protein Cas6/Cse3/CasE [Hyphomicrobiales bacterium]|nr:type I-E CRISPR-associated protein Cas6/Cse3/CasE [Hyphomicrobiales bacterium]
MTAPLSLIRLRPDAQALMRWAMPRGYLSHRADLGYALHAALKAALGELAPRPFVWRERRESPELLGYVRCAADDIKTAAALPRVDGGEAAVALRLLAVEASAMPGHWRAGQRLSFEVRVRPIVRSRSDPQAKEKGSRRHVEVDAALYHASEQDAPIGHEKAYCSWLAARIEHRGAKLVQARLVTRRSVGVLRRPQISGERKPVVTQGPEAVFQGVLEIASPEAFHAGLLLGVGRHCAFGFGMMLLAPPGAFEPC